MSKVLFLFGEDPPKYSAILVDDDIMEASKELFDEKIASVVSTFFPVTKHEITYAISEFKSRQLLCSHGDYIVKVSYATKQTEYLVVTAEEFKESFRVEDQFLDAKDILGGSIVFNNNPTLTIEETVVNQIRDAILDKLVTWVKK